MTAFDAIECENRARSFELNSRPVRWVWLFVGDHYRSLSCGRLFYCTTARAAALVYRATRIRLSTRNAEFANIRIAHSVPCEIAKSQDLPIEVRVCVNRLWTVDEIFFLKIKTNDLTFRMRVAIRHSTRHNVENDQILVVRVISPEHVLRIGFPNL